MVEIRILSVIGEVWEGNENIIEKMDEGDPCYIVAENLVEFYLIVMWKAEFISNELNWTKIFKQIAKSVALVSSCCL